MSSFEDRLVAAVKRKREREGLSIRALSAIVDVSFSSLARIERGEGQPDNNSKIRLLEWLGPDADEEGLRFDEVAFVHFRAAKNVQSATVQTLLAAADCVKRSRSPDVHPTTLEPPAAPDEPVSLSKEELEATADRFRRDLGLAEDEPLDSLRLTVEGVEFLQLTETECLTAATVRRLANEACDEWSAMSVPLDAAHDQWAVLLNNCHDIRRQRVTLLEEMWHILLGHKLVKIAKIAEAYGRTYDKAEEHDAYYLASATLLPRDAIHSRVQRKERSAKIADEFGTSAELVDYRIKRLGLWRDHVGKKVELSSE